MAWVNLLEAIYPVGSVYLAINSTSPASIVGGTWAAMTGGMLGLAGSTGVATSGSNGGSLTIISTNQLPAHGHYLKSARTGDDTKLPSSGTKNPLYYWPLGSMVSNVNTNIISEDTGGGRITFPPIPAFMVGNVLPNLRKELVVWRG